MRYSIVLPFVAAATAIVIPNDVTLQGLAINVEDRVAHGQSSSWWEQVPSLDDLRISVEDAVSSTAGALERGAKSFFKSLPSESDILPTWEHPDHPGHPKHPPGRGRPGRGHGKPHHPHVLNLTLYEVISKSNFTKKFAKLIDEYPDIVKALNSTKHNLTAFVPTDKAFERIPEHHKKPSKEFIERLLGYHVVSGLYPAGRILASRTLPTLLEEEELGGNSQRLRVTFGLGGVRLNFYSKVIAANLFTANGVAHAVDSIIIPPPEAPKIISFAPDKFSTVLLAAEKTGLAKRFDEVHSTGATYFVPTNFAFRKLGPRANAFLFNTEKGLGYLKAILKYHVVLNETLYSDAYYGREKDEADSKSTDRQHVDLPTLLEGKSISIDISRWGGWIDFKVNGYIHVAVTDVPAKGGVIHVVNSVLIPPHEHKKALDAEAEIEVDDLIERLAPYVENKKDNLPSEL